MQKTTICIGSIVTIYDREEEEQATYEIISNKKEKTGASELVFDSALASSLIGHTMGEVVTVKADQEYEVEIIKIDNSNVKQTAIPTQPNAGQLIRNLFKGYGGRAQVIYDDCCKRFGWDANKRGLFAPQKPLYAKGATPERYSPLFLAHSNWTESKGSNWTNTISAHTIEEKWDIVNSDFYRDTCTRVVFAKSKHCNWEYVFIGVYKPVGYREERLQNGKKRWIKIFERISDVYG